MPEFSGEYRPHLYTIAPVTFEAPKKSRRLRVTPKQAENIDQLKLAALAVIEENKLLQADRLLLDKLEAFWKNGHEDMGTDEMGTVHFRRVLILAAIRTGDTQYPDVRSLIRDMVAVQREAPKAPAASEVIQ